MQTNLALVAVLLLPLRVAAEHRPGSLDTTRAPIAWQGTITATWHQRIDTSGATFRGGVQSQFRRILDDRLDVVLDVCPDGAVGRADWREEAYAFEKHTTPGLAAAFCATHEQEVETRGRTHTEGAVPVQIDALPDGRYRIGFATPPYRVERERRVRSRHLEGPQCAAPTDETETEAFDAPPMQLYVYGRADAFAALDGSPGWTSLRGEAYLPPPGEPDAPLIRVAWDLAGN